MSYIDEIRKKQKTPDQAKADAQKEQSDKRLRWLNSKVNSIIRQIHSAIEKAANNGMRNIIYTPEVYYNLGEDSYYYSNNPNIIGSYRNVDIYQYDDNYIKIYGSSPFYAYIPQNEFPTIIKLVSEQLKKDGFVDFTVSFEPIYFIKGKIIKSKHYWGYDKLTITISW